MGFHDVHNSDILLNALPCLLYHPVQPAGSAIVCFATESKAARSQCMSDVMCFLRVGTAVDLSNVEGQPHILICNGIERLLIAGSCPLSVISTTNSDKHCSVFNPLAFHHGCMLFKP